MGAARGDLQGSVPASGSGALGRDDARVEGNARLTASVAVVLFVLLALEGATLVGVRRMLSPHVFIGTLLVVPVGVKIASTTYRALRYYLGTPAYRRRGPPPLLLRLLGPVVVVLTVVVIASGIAALIVGSSWRHASLFVHKASFVLWFGAMAVHVLGHLVETGRVAPRDWRRRSTRHVGGVAARRLTVLASVVLGLPLALLLVERVGPWLAQTGR